MPNYGQTSPTNAQVNPFVYDKDAQGDETEYSWGAGRFANPVFDYSGGGSRSRIPIADPDQQAQLLKLAAYRRMNLSSANETAQGMTYLPGNPDRYGAQPPLVRNRKKPKPSKRPPVVIARMHREW